MKSVNIEGRATQKERDALLQPYLSISADPNQILYFRNLPLKVLEILVTRDFVDMNPWNDCPGTNRFLGFMRRHPNFTAHGYAISFRREDHRITIEGLECQNPLTHNDIVDFCGNFCEADEFQVSNSYARCWYD